MPPKTQQKAQSKTLQSQLNFPIKKSSQNPEEQGVSKMTESTNDTSNMGIRNSTTQPQQAKTHVYQTRHKFEVNKYQKLDHKESIDISSTEHSQVARSQLQQENRVTKVTPILPPDPAQLSALNLLS